MSPPVAQLAELFSGPAGRRYLGEPVSVGEHLLQSAALAEAAGAGAALILAALLHDVGYLITATAPREAHEEIAARYLSRFFPAPVVEPIRLHVAAKRYLCATEPDYGGVLSPASVASLARRGGPFAAAGVAAFGALPHAAEAVRLRRYDDQAKVPGLVVPPFSSYRERLEGALREAPSGEAGRDRYTGGAGNDD